VLTVGTAVARADLTASYDGELRTGRARTVAVVGALVESNGTVTASVDVALTDPRGGVYFLSGFRHGRHIVLRGINGAGSRLAWHATIRRTELSGVARLSLRRHRAHGSLVLRVRAVTPPPPPSKTCDSAYFRDVVMKQVLVPICGQCHVPGGIAQGANFRVTASDPVATEESVALNIDTADPSASRLLQKPLATIPHGGGQQIVPGSSADQILSHWVDLVASGQCGGGSGGGGTGNPALDLFTANCASCHGAAARGVGMKPDIHCSRAIHDVVRSGRTGGAAGDMPAFPNLSEADIATLQGYLDGLCPAPTGADLYASNCASCHGAYGGGTARAPAARCATRVTDALTVGRAAAMPAFSAFTPDDVTHVQQVLDLLCTAFGVSGADLFAANCSSCHGANGGGGQNAFGEHGPDIRCYDIPDFFDAVQSGYEVMPPFPTLDADRIGRIILWVHGTCGG
jgi:mono/diheme cytochrome c family protein